jgi:hypothetical protein
MLLSRLVLLLGLVCVVGDACCSSVCGWLCVCVQRSTPFEGGAAVCCVVVFVLVVGWGSMLCVV